MDSQSKEKLNAFFAQYNTYSFSHREKVLEPSEELPYLFFLTNGAVRMYALSPEGEEVTLTIFRTESIFPLMLVLSNQPNTYYFEAIEEATAIKAPTSETIAFIQKEPEILFDITSRFAQAICGLSTRIEYLSFEAADKRLINLLIYLADTFGEKQGKSIRISLPLRHEDLGQWIGATRETISRHISRLQNKKLIQVNQKHIIISDIALLKTQIAM